MLKFKLNSSFKLKNSFSILNYITMKLKFLFILFAITSMGIVACGDDIDCSDEVALQAEIQDEQDAVNAAILTYTTDPSTDNCESLVDALQEWIDALKDLEDCAREVGEYDEFQEAIMQAEDDLDTIEC